MDRSLRRLGQLLVVMGALLGAVLGVALALIVENANTSGASGQEHAAVLAVGPSSSRPPVSRGTDAEDSAAGNGASGRQQAGAANQTDQGNGKSDMKNEGRHDKPGKGEDRSGKGKDK